MTQGSANAHILSGLVLHRVCLGVPADVRLRRGAVRHALADGLNGRPALARRVHGLRGRDGASAPRFREVLPMSAGAATPTLDATTHSHGRASGQRVSWWFSDGSRASSWSTRSHIAPHAKQIPNDQLGDWLVRAVFRLIQRVFIAEAVLWLTALICALAGFPAVLTAFCVALVAFVVNTWLAVRTLAPVFCKFVKGGR